MRMKLAGVALAGLISLVGCGGGGGGGGGGDIVIVNPPVQNPIQVATALFNTLRTDLLSLSNTNKDGFLDKKLKDAQTDFSTNADLGAFKRVIDAMGQAAKMSASLQINAVTFPTTNAGLKLVNEFSGGSPTVPSISYYLSSTGYQLIADSSGKLYRVRTSSIDNFSLNYACFADIANYKIVTCFLDWIDLTTTTTATGTTRNYLGFQITETAVSGATRTYSWKSGTIQRAVVSATTVASDTFVGTPLTGTTTASFNANVSPPVNMGITAATLKGDVMPFNTNVAKAVLDITENETIDAASNVKTTNLSGTVTKVMTSGGATAVTMAILSGSQGLEQMPAKTPISMKLITQIKTAAFQYDGTLSAGSFGADKTGGNFTAGTMTFNGTVSTLAGGVATEFLNGALTAKLTNHANFDSTKPVSATNFEPMTGSFEGKVTNAGTVYDLLFTIDGTAYDPQKVTLAYTKATSKLITVNATVYNFPPTGRNTLTASNADGSITISVSQGPNGAIGTVNSGSTKIGDITGNKVVFTDGTFLTFI